MDAFNTEFVRMLDKSGWSQSEAGRRLGLTPQAISMIVSGKNRPSLTTLKLFKLMVGDMAPIPGEKETSLELREGMRPIDDAENALLDMLRGLDEPIRQAAMEHFRSLAGLMHPPRKPQVQDVKYPRGNTR